jgi:hypothetical protein
VTYGKTNIELTRNLQHGSTEMGRVDENVSSTSSCFRWDSLQARRIARAQAQESKWPIPLASHLAFMCLISKWGLEPHSNAGGSCAACCSS